VTDTLTHDAVSLSPAQGQDEAATQSAVGRNAGWQRCFEQLRMIFDKYDARDQSVFLYLMVDGRGNPGIDDLLTRVPELGYASLWRDTMIESYTDVAPYLISLDRIELEDERSLQHRLVRRLWREATAPMLTWMWSPHALETMVSHYQRYVVYSLPDRKAFYLHFYDNRILEHLKRAWTEEEAQQFIAPCSEIGYRDRSLIDVVWENGNPPVPSATEEPQTLTSEQHQLLIELAYADKLALHLRTRCGASLEHLSPSELYGMICKLLERAGTYRIRSEEDCLMYVTCGALSAPTFDEHPEIHDRLLAMTREEKSLADALHGIPDQVWDAIREKNTDA
jgi:hypothetical protein